jgi:hypothetical protein
MHPQRRGVELRELRIEPAELRIANTELPKPLRSRRAN